MTEVTSKGLYGSGLILTFGTDTDDDTIRNMFGHLKGYVICLNGVDVEVIDPLCMAGDSMDRNDDRDGIMFDSLGKPGTYEGTPHAYDHPAHVQVVDWIAWDDVESVHVY